MVSLDEAIAIVKTNKTKPIVCALETNDNFYFTYGFGITDGYYKVGKQTGVLDIFYPQDDFDEYEAMEFVKDL